MDDGYDWREGLTKWPRAVPHFEIDVSTAALIVIDMQRLFLDPSIGMCREFELRHPDAATAYFRRVNEIIVPNCATLLGVFRDARRPVLFTTVGPESADLAHYLVPRLRAAHDREEDEGRPGMFQAGTWEHGIVEELEPQAEEVVLNKVTSSAFTSTGIDVMLRNYRASDLVFVGVASDSCVALTARDAADRGYRCAIVEDACGSFDPRSHADALRTFARVAGVVVRTADMRDA
jgi:biuret amidohydrolase